MFALALVVVLAAQATETDGFIPDDPQPSPAPVFDIASVAVHLGKNVVITKVDGSIVAGELLEVRRDHLVVRVYSFRDQPNVSRDVYLSAVDIEAFRLGPAATS